MADPFVAESQILHRTFAFRPERVVSASGVSLFLESGREILDASAGPAVSCLGHGRKDVALAVYRQLDQLAYLYSGARFTCDATEELASMLLRDRPGGLSKAIFVNSGSEATDAAIKLATQYWHEKGQPRKRFVIARKQSYHGNTIGALCVSGHDSRRALYRDWLSLNVHFVDPCLAYRMKRPGESDEAYAQRLAAQLEDQILELGAENVSSFIAETVSGTTLGCAAAVPGYFRAVRALCDKYDILLILDEIMCGMGKTGTVHAWEQEGISGPDLQTVGKALGGGFVPLSGVFLHEKIFDALKAGSGGLAHGHTFQAHPAACAGAIEVQRIIQKENLLDNVVRMGKVLGRLLREQLGCLEFVGDVRGRGLFWAVEFMQDPQTREPFGPEAKFCDQVVVRALDLGLNILGNLGTTGEVHVEHVIMSPPYVVTEEELGRMVAILREAIICPIPGDPTGPERGSTEALPHAADGAVHISDSALSFGAGCPRRSVKHVTAPLPQAGRCVPRRQAATTCVNHQFHTMLPTVLHHPLATGSVAISAPSQDWAMGDLVASRRPRSHGHARQRRGCQTCRGRKKKCNQSYPICGHCSRLNLVCSWEDPRVLKDGQDAAAANAPAVAHSGQTQTTGARPDHGQSLVSLSRLADPLLLLPSTGGGEALSSSRRAMMRYYTATFAFMLTTNVENNCFLSVLLPMAFECQALTYALAAFSSTHLALRNDAFGDISLRHRGQVLSELKNAMSRGSMSEEMCLATTMVLCSMESISHAADSWIHHLAGAAATLLPSAEGEIPDSLRLSLQSSFEGRWLLRNFAYHDILMSVSMDRRPFVRGDYWLYGEDRETLADPYFGFAAKVLHLIGEISNMNADLERLFDDSKTLDEAWAAVCEGPAELTISQRAHDIERELHSWVCLANHADMADASLLLLGEAYRHGALIHLYRVLRKHVPTHAPFTHLKIQGSISAICAAASAMPDESLAGCTMLFPLFIAGGETENSAQIETIRERLLIMNQWRHFGNFDRCIDVLDEVWRLSSAGTRKDNADKVDWLDIVQRRGWKIALT